MSCVVSHPSFRHPSKLFIIPLCCSFMVFSFSPPFQARESLLALSSSQTQLKRELAEGRDALEKMAALNEALAKDKRELSVRALQVWHAGLAHL